MNKAKSEGYTDDYSPGLLFGIFFGINILSRLPDPYWLVSNAIFLAFIPPFQAFNGYIENATSYKGVYNNAYSTRQIILLILGCIFWILIIFTFLGEAFLAY